METAHVATNGRLNPVKVLIVDDSAVVRQILSRELAKDPQIEVIGTAGDPIFALEKLNKAMPDVIVLDIEMPRMDGLTFLRSLMPCQPANSMSTERKPIPVIILSSLAERGTQMAIDAMAAGAVEVFSKPQGSFQNGTADTIQRLAFAIKGAAQARPFAGTGARQFPVAFKPGAIPLNHAQRKTDQVIAVAASTGGTEALKLLFSELPVDSPGILAVLHMPQGFTRRYAERLNELCTIDVREACDGDRLHAGLALLAPGGYHLALNQTSKPFSVNVLQGPQVCRHRPSAEVLFQSVARGAGPNALGIMLTGMGSDGADGLLAMRQAGAHTIAQDEQSCVIFGMPKEAIRRGAAAEVLSLDRISAACTRWSKAALVQHA